MASSVTEKKHFAETGHCRICNQNAKAIKEALLEVETVNSLLLSANHDVGEYVIYSDKLKEEVLFWQNEAEQAYIQLKKLQLITE